MGTERIGSGYDRSTNSVIGFVDHFSVFSIFSGDSKKPPEEKQIDAPYYWQGYIEEPVGGWCKSATGTMFLKYNGVDKEIYHVAQEFERKGITSQDVADYFADEIGCNVNYIECYPPLVPVDYFFKKSLKNHIREIVGLRNQPIWCALRNVNINVDNGHCVKVHLIPHLRFTIIPHLFS